MRVADYIFERLHEAGVNHVFMVTGRGALFLTDAVAKHPGITGVCVHHEQSAAFCAVAYSDTNNKIAACLVSTGCASTNAMTGVLNAWQDGIPCVFISGQNTLAETTRYSGKALRTFGQQEADIVALVSPITKYATMISDPESIGFELDKALFLSQDKRKGPVWIDVPLDIQNMRVNPESLSRYSDSSGEGEKLRRTDLEYVVESLKASERPVVLIGSGVRSAAAEKLLESFIETTQIPVVYSPSAPDVYGTEYSLSIGSVGIMGCSRAGNFALQNSDLLLVLGNRLSPMTTGSDYCKFAREAKVIVVDIDEIEHTKNTVEIDKLINSDINIFLSELLSKNIKVTGESWKKKCLNWKRIFPKCEDQFKHESLIDIYHLTDTLSRSVKDNSLIVTDSGLTELILPSNFNFRKGMRCIHPVSQGSMGYAIPAAIGAYYANENSLEKRSVIVVVGDGSIMMNLQELETIRHNKLKIKIIVVSNNLYAVIRKRQKDMFRKRTIGTDQSNGISCPDFDKVAATFGLAYMKISCVTELEEKLTEFIESDEATLCEIVSPENQDYIAIAHARTKEHGFVRRPLEDQAPFLDRELFLSEMIVKPIDQ